MEPVTELKKLGAVVKRNDNGEAVTVGLGGTQISDAGLVYLKGLTELDLLNIFGTQVTDVDLVHFKAMTNIQTLFLTDTNLTAAAFADLQKALPYSSIND